MTTESAASPARPVNLRCEYLENPAGIDVTAPRLSWRIDDPRRGAKQTAYRIRVASTPELLADGSADLWNSGVLESDDTVHIEYSGKTLASRQRCFWTVQIRDGDGVWSEYCEPAFWSMGLLSRNDWKAQWIGAQSPIPDTEPSPCPYIRKEFEMKKAVSRATVFVSAKGLYELYVNGRKTSEDYFRPGWTDYNQRIQYQTYDVTDRVVQGKNTIGAILGDGWCCGFVGFKKQRKIYADRPRLLAQLVIDYADGSSTTIATDGSWKYTLDGPLRGSDMLKGETYDARMAFPGWSAPGFDDGRWAFADVEALGDIPLVAACSEPVRATQELPVQDIAEPSPGVYVLDLAQNMVGVVRLKIDAPSGTTITIRHAEMLNPDGTIYTENLRSADSIDRYVCRGGGLEIYQPRFTFHGFRYVELTGLPSAPDLDTITGVVLHSDAPVTGSFECSHPTLNRLQKNILWGMRGNYLEVPTDCPQRDERLGWMGDAQIFIRTGCSNMDIAAFHTKWMRDVEDAQRENGAYTDIAPDIGLGEGVAAWAEAGIIVPWTIYLCYGDTKILEEHYESFARYIDYLATECDGHLRPHRGYGDWLSIGAETPKDLIGTAYYAYAVQLVEKIATVLGKTNDATKYGMLFEEIKKTFQSEYVTPAGRVSGETQTAYLLAMAFDLLPESVREHAAESLEKDILRRGTHLSTGFVGCGYALPILAAAGRFDLACRLLVTDTFPSWLYSVRHGATTIWERWDGWTAENGFQNPSMNSFNHYAFGAVGEFLYRVIAGIDLDESAPGYRHILIRPQLCAELTHARAEYESIRGMIVSNWRIEDGSVHLDVSIPPNTTATVRLPARDADAVTESGTPLHSASGVTNVRFEADAIFCEIGAGSYSFLSLGSAGEK